jgi:hypothetical protein
MWFEPIDNTNLRRHTNTPLQQAQVRQLSAFNTAMAQNHDIFIRVDVGINKDDIAHCYYEALVLGLFFALWSYQSFHSNSIQHQEFPDCSEWFRCQWPHGQSKASP